LFALVYVAFYKYQKKIVALSRRGVKHTARGPKPARCEVESGPRDNFVK